MKRALPSSAFAAAFRCLAVPLKIPTASRTVANRRSRKGLGFLPVRTVLHAEKTVRRVQGCLRSEFLGLSLRPETRFQGYEIHVGETFYEPGARPIADIVRQGIPGSVPDGAVSASGRVLGTYVHGFFDNDDFRHAFLAAARRAVDLAPAETWANVARRTRSAHRPPGGSSQKITGYESNPELDHRVCRNGSLNQE